MDRTISRFGTTPFVLLAFSVILAAPPLTSAVRADDFRDAATASPAAYNGGGIAELHAHDAVLVSRWNPRPFAPARERPQYIPATEGKPLRDGQGLRTLEHACAELDFHDASVLRLNERTDVVVQDLPALRRVVLQAGTIWIKAAHGGVHTQIQTPVGTAVAHDTVCEVAQDIDEPGVMRLLVQEGRVDLWVGGSVVRSVGPGEVVRLTRSGFVGDVARAGDAVTAAAETVAAASPWWEEVARTLGTAAASRFDSAAREAAGAVNEVLAAPAKPALPVQAAAAAPAVTKSAPTFSPATLESILSENYTGVVIDARGLPNFQRSPSPVIYGPDQERLYPDPSHVPTPDEVQDESVIRYYATEDAITKGFVGDHPLVIRAVSAVGPGNDCCTVSAEDALLLKALDKKIHFTQTWKVGVLLPAGQ